MATIDRAARKEEFVERVLLRVLTKHEEEEARAFAMLWERVLEIERSFGETRLATRGVR